MFNFMMGRGDRHWGPPGPGPWMFRMRHGGRRRRGDVRAAILALLDERPMHGYEMIQELEERTDGVWRPSPGAIYPALQLLEDQGLVTADAEAGKRLFSLTDSGREEVAKLGDRKPWEQAAEEADDERQDLFASIKQFAPAVIQIAQVGTPDQAQRAKAILDDGRKKLYAILAEEE